MRILPSSVVTLAALAFSFGAGAASSALAPRAQQDGPPVVRGDAGQDGGEQDADDPLSELDPSSPFFDARRAERARIEKELEGAWLLVRFETATDYFREDEFRGFMMFRGGYATLIFEGYDSNVGLFGEEEELTIQASAYRYRLGQRNELQLANILGFDNANPEGELIFQQANQAADMDLDVRDDTLTLSKPGGSTFEYRRLKSSEFPRGAIDALREGRSAYGSGLTEDD